MDLEEIWWEAEDWIHPAQERDQLRDLETSGSITEDILTG
jgi:hypothetical protein